MNYLLAYLIGAGFNAGLSVGSGSWRSTSFARRIAWLLLWPYFVARFALISFVLSRS